MNASAPAAPAKPGSVDDQRELERAFWREVRRALLVVVRAIETRYDIGNK